MTGGLVELRCKEAARLMCQKRDRELSAEEAQQLKEHLFDCQNCTRFDQQLDFLQRMARQYAEGLPVDGKES
jgi:hypothetical protein